MRLIIVLEGSSEGRRLVKYLVQAGKRVGLVSYSSLEKGPDLEGTCFIKDAMSITGTPAEWLLKWRAEVVVDARHPFTPRAPGTKGDEWERACAHTGVVYYRVGRRETPLAGNDLVHIVFSMEEAAEIAARLGTNIFLTTGSHGWEPFLKLRDELGLRLVVRVLPEHKVVKKCQDMGFKPRDIVAMQGPFSKQVNKALFKMYRASVIVTRDGGRAGGTNSKLAAAAALGLPVVLVRNKNSGRILDWREVLRLLTKI